jgi:hypothetical protein
MTQGHGMQATSHCIMTSIKLHVYMYTSSTQTMIQPGVIGIFMP